MTESEENLAERFKGSNASKAKTRVVLNFSKNLLEIKSKKLIK
jgi:hypothetical protein